MKKKYTVVLLYPDYTTSFRTAPYVCWVWSRSDTIDELARLAQNQWARKSEDRIDVNQRKLDMEYVVSFPGWLEGV